MHILDYFKSKSFSERAVALVASGDVKNFRLLIGEMLLGMQETGVCTIKSKRLETFKLGIQMPLFYESVNKETMYRLLQEVKRIRHIIDRFNKPLNDKDKLKMLDHLKEYQLIQMSIFDLIKQIRETEYAEDTEVEIGNGVKKSKKSLDIKSIIKEVIPHISKDRPFDYKFHASNWNMCSRVFFLNSLVGATGKGKPSWSTRWTFSVGDAFHWLLQKCMTIWANIYSKSVTVEHEVSLSSSDGSLVGSCDTKITFLDDHFGFEKGEIVILEFKTVNLNSFNNIQIAPYDSHIAQVQLYMYMTGAKKAIIFYALKDAPSFKQYDIAYDEAFVQGVLAKMEYALDCVSTKTVPDKNLGCDLVDFDKKCSQYVNCKKLTKGTLDLVMKGDTDND